MTALYEHYENKTVHKTFLENCKIVHKHLIDNKE